MSQAFLRTPMSPRIAVRLDLPLKGLAVAGALRFNLEPASFLLVQPPKVSK